VGVEGQERANGKVRTEEKVKENVVIGQGLEE
jgi:hypothetical protein